jgi:hypothetical protein
MGNKIVHRDLKILLLFRCFVRISTQKYIIQKKGVVNPV